MDSWHRELFPKELTTDADVRVKSRHSSLCIMCRGGRNLCGKYVCPIELKAKAYTRNFTGINATEFAGSSPPAVFVGRFGYPNVYVGPMVPPVLGNTEIMDTPEAWIDKPVDTIVNYRYSLVRGNTRMPIDSVEKGGRVIESLQELAMGTSPADTEMELLKKPCGSVSFDDNSQPFGPSAPLKKFDVASIKVDQRIEKAYYDKDLKSREAVSMLYDSGLTVTRIQKAFSMGIFGISKKRRLVPTRWSITAVDSLLSNGLIDEIKDYETIDKYLVFVHSHQYNVFVSIFIPRHWSFEWMEAWFPGTFWNPSKSEPAVEGDYEGYHGRKTYPDIGGCYFSTRLAVSEYLKKIRKQASVLVLREIMPEFPLPLGVWFVRENIRAMLNKQPALFDDLKSCTAYIKNFLKVPLSRWLERSSLLTDLYCQRRLDDYFNRC